MYGRTPLHMACYGGHLDVVRKLVSEHGCDVMARDSDGRIPLHNAAWSGKKEVSTGAQLTVCPPMEIHPFTWLPRKVIAV